MKSVLKFYFNLFLTRSALRKLLHGNYISILCLKRSPLLTDKLVLVVWLSISV